ncbi:MAG: adenylate/guanylate cyclase domain-containing protein [Rhodospirillaceae bacterium]|nr:adenylate/guanylate cyclase domain-containing protein [Rhodospirillaceae bacterium]
MKAITHYEVYVVKHGSWALQARLSHAEQSQALELARSIQADTEQATQVLEESLEPEQERLVVRVIGQYGQAPMDTKGPSTDTNMTSRIFMVVVNAFGIGAIVTMMMAIGLGSLRGSATGNSFNMLLLFIFAATLLTAGLTLFKIYVPMEWILWRGKGLESQKRTIETLLYGTRETAPKWRPPVETETPVDIVMDADADVDTPAAIEAEPPPPAPAEQPDGQEPAPRMETNADQGEQTSFQIGAAPDTATAAPARAESLVDSAAAVMESLLEKDRAQLLAFADSALSGLMATREQLQSFERVGLNLYLAGAAGALAERAGFSDNIKIELLNKALVHSGTNAAVAEAFSQRLGTAGERPRFRHLIDAGHTAMSAVIDNNTNTPLPPLPDLIAQWADASARGAEVKKVAFLLTDIVGSTALTSKLGNSAAQRIVRAHNSAVRSAAKNFRGTEIKHTGDGMLLSFPDPAAAARAAIEIQQEGTAYARENPDAPLVMRLGVHFGEASFEDGEYYGPALAILNGVCAAAGNDEIYCSEDAKAKAVGPVFRFQDMGKKTLKGSGLECKCFKLEWTPKIKAPKGPVEYTQIGRKSPVGA